MKALGNVLARLNSSTSRSKTVPQTVVEEHVPDSARRVLDHLANAIATTDAAGNLTYLNHAAEQLVGHELADAHGLPLADVLPLRNELTGQAIRLPTEKVLLQGRSASLPDNTVLERADGKRLAIDGNLTPTYGADGRVTGIALTLQDVTKSRMAAARLAHDAHHDALTGLVNRREFESRVKRAVESARARGIEHALCFIDLDQFKIINDTCGHAAGDELLRQLSRLLQSQVRQRDTLARLGGDEFGLLLEGCPLKEADVLAGSLLRALRGFRFNWQDKTFGIGASIGLTAITAASADMETVLNAADAACYAAKEKGRNLVQSYQPDDKELVDRKTEMRQVSRITSAIDGNNFALYVQPILPLGAGPGGDHYEILARMKSPSGDLIAPGEFIPAAERYNLMPSLDRVIIKNAFAAYRQVYPHVKKRDLNTWAINISGASLASDGLINFIREQAVLHNVPPQVICFEITESAAIASFQKALDFIWGLKIDGFRFALDDFGKGMSSFAYLKNLPVNYLKIDGEFVKDIVNDKVSAGMVDAINRVGRLMGLQTIAEYVENDAILELLRDMGINFAQGYGVGKPMSIDLLPKVITLKQKAFDPLPDLVLPIGNNADWQRARTH